MDMLTVVLEKDLFEEMIYAFNFHQVPSNHLKANIDYTIKSVEIKDEFFKDDATYDYMKKLADEAYRKLKKYEFDKRNK